MSDKRSVEQIAYDIYEKPLSAEDFQRLVDATLANEAEQAHIAELIAWFTRRYPTAEARLQYARKHTLAARAAAAKSKA
jgi:hypothetical protein